MKVTSFILSLLFSIYWDWVGPYNSYSAIS